MDGTGVRKEIRLDEGYRIPIEALWGTVGSGRIILLSMCTVERITLLKKRKSKTVWCVYYVNVQSTK
jgi:hypothetical protein